MEEAEANYTKVRQQVEQVHREYEQVALKQAAGKATLAEMMAAEALWHEAERETAPVREAYQSQYQRVEDLAEATERVTQEAKRAAADALRQQYTHAAQALATALDAAVQANETVRQLYAHIADQFSEPTFLRPAFPLALGLPDLAWPELRAQFVSGVNVGREVDMLVVDEKRPTKTVTVNGREREVVNYVPRRQPIGGALNDTRYSTWQREAQAFLASHGDQ